MKLWRHRRGIGIGAWAVGYEARRYTFSLSFPLVFPVVWRDMPEQLAPAPELDIEWFEQRAARRGEEAKRG